MTLEMPLQPASTIRYADLGDVLVILDIASESYYVIDPVGRSMWNHLLRLEHPSDVLKALRQEYPADPARLEADLGAFIDRMIRQNFLEERRVRLVAEVPRRAAAPWAGCLTLRAWACLALTVRSLSARGFARTYLRYARFPAPASGIADEGAQTLLRRGVAAFRRAEGLFVMRRAPQDCLPRSLALFRFLRSLGLPAEHCIGVRRFPFTAHAWVECWGKVIQEDPALRLALTIVARLSA